MRAEQLTQNQKGQVLRHLTSQAHLGFTELEAGAITHGMKEPAAVFGVSVS